MSAIEFRRTCGTVWIKTRRIRCPKCRQPPDAYVEFSIAMSTFSARSGERDEEGYNTHGGCTHVIAVCSCGHRWRLRGVSQIAELDAIP